MLCAGEFERETEKKSAGGHNIEKWKIARSGKVNNRNGEGVV